MDDGLVDERWWRSRQDDYLAAATTVWSPTSPLNVADHLERRRRDPSFPVDLDALDDAALAAWFARIDHWRDCADFDVLRLLHLWYGDRAGLPAAVVDALAERFVGFTYWYTDPHPHDVVDQRWYWSENHRLIFHACEHLAGQAFPDTTFAVTGMTGTDHRERAAARLHEWFDEKARHGFSEWHSDVYYEKDLAPLLSLAEWADDPTVAGRAAAFLDLVLFDLALHLHRGTMGSTHGRSYMKDKSCGPDQPAFAPAKLLFDDTDEPWPLDDGDARRTTPRTEGATLLARARRYRPPAVLRRVATSRTTVVDREGMGLAIDPAESRPDDPGVLPTRADGLRYDDPDLVPFWWDRSALTTWQLVGLTMDTLDRHRLWDADLFAPFRAVREVTGGDRGLARQLAHDLAPIVNAGLLAEVNTITYRTEHVMLSTAQSYRVGCAGYQQHVWQATLDERAVVFTTHPANEPWTGTDRYEDADHYWTGSATLPRAVQHDGVVVCCYSPAYPSPELDVLAGFRYLDRTHAFFPTEHFDRVVADGHWTLGARHHGYVALWSWRPVAWRTHDPDAVFTGALREPFDLVADGGASNVWIAEVGDAHRWGSFEAFRAAVTAARPEVVDHGADEAGAHRGFDVRYRSAAGAALALGPTGPLSVDGVEVAIDSYPRFDNPWCRAERGATALRIADGSCSLDLDLAAGTRHAAGPC